MTSQTYQMTRCALFTAIMCVCAIVRITWPFSPTPITFQTLGVVLAGAVLGRKGGATSMGLYILLGVVGLPVFSGFTSGLGVLTGPGGGYILGFVPAAFLVGLLTEKRWHPLLAMAMGVLVFYTTGVLQMMVVLHMNAVQAVGVGAVPFVAFDMLKILLATVLIGRYNDLLPHRRS